MTITTTGTNNIDPVTGLNIYGDNAAGSLTVNGGSVATVTASNTASEPEIAVGLGNGGNGTVSVTGTGSQLNVTSNGTSGAGGFIAVGLDAGAFGTLNVTAGASLSVTDTLGSGGSYTTGGQESIVVGENSGAGVMNVDSASVSISGTGSFFEVGNFGGTGTATFSNSSNLSVTTSTGHADDAAGINVGTGQSSTGTLTFNASTASVVGNGNSAAFLSVGTDNLGQGGTGTVTLLNASTVSVTGNNDPYTTLVVGEGAGTKGTLNISASALNVTANAQNQYSFIGENGGDGTVNLNNGSLTVTGALESGLLIGRGDGSTGDMTAENGSIVTVNGHNSASIGVGTDYDQTGGGTGTAEFKSGSTLDINGGTDATDFIGLTIGVDNANTDGSLSFDASTLTADVEGEIYVGIGRQGGTGDLSLTNNSTASFSSQSTAYSGMSVGRETGGDGTISVVNSSFSLSNADGETYFNLGRSGGTGNLDLNSGTFNYSSSSWSGINAGRDAGSVGNISLINNSTLQFQSGFGSYFSFGRDGGTSTVDVTNSTLRFIGTGAGTDPTTGNPKDTRGYIGRDAGSTGTVNVTNGGSLEILDSGADAFLNVGRTTGATGTLNIVDSASTISSTGAVGSAFLNLGRDGGAGNLTVDNSTLNITSTNGFATMRLGMDFAYPSEPGGIGTGEIKNGSTVTISGDSSRLSVGYTTGTSGNLQILSGSLISVTSTGGTENDSGVLVGTNAGTNSAVLLIDGAGSTLAGGDFVAVGYPTIEGAPDVGNGVLTVQNGGRVEAVDVYIGRGGLLNFGTGTVEATGLVANTSDTGALILEDGTLRVLDGAVAQLNGDLDIRGASTITFEVAADGSSSGKINQDGAFLEADGSYSIEMDAQGGYIYAQGDSYTILETNVANIGNPFDSGTNSVTGQNAGFGYLYTQTNGATTTTFDFTALNNGNGTGWSVLDFGAASTSAATFEYDSTLGTGDGDGGAWSGLFARNVDEVRGTSANDQFTATGTGSILFRGAAGDDTLIGGLGNDTLIGDDGNDTLEGHGGNDRVFGGDGNDILRGGDGDDYIVGNDGDDLIDGGAGHDNLHGRAGNDRIFGLNGSDVLRGFEGDDYLVGNDGNDLLVGGTGNDNLQGRAGNDRLFGEDGDDALRGFEGEDYLVGNAGDDLIAGYSEHDSLHGRAGEDRMYGGLGDDYMKGGTENDYVVGNQGNDALYGEDGHDKLHGRDGNDRLYGGSGNDYMKGGAGNDLLDGGDKFDSLFGEGGSDTFVFNGNWRFDTIKDWEDGVDTMDMSGSAANSFSDLTIVQQGANTFINITGDTYNGITLEGVTFSNIDAGDFVF